MKVNINVLLGVLTLSLAGLAGATTVFVNGANPVASDTNPGTATQTSIRRSTQGRRRRQVITIPVYGHSPITRSGKATTCQVYDLACRYVTLNLPSKVEVKTLTDKVTPYAIIAPTYLTVKLTKVSPYDIEASLVPAREHR